MRVISRCIFGLRIAFIFLYFVVPSSIYALTGGRLLSGEEDPSSVVLIGPQGPFCSGTVISKRLILTAGHCVLRSFIDRDYNFVFDQRSVAMPLGYSNGNLPQNDSEKMKSSTLNVKAFHVHPTWEKRQKDFEFQVENLLKRFRQKDASPVELLELKKKLNDHEASLEKDGSLIDIALIESEFDLNLPAAPLLLDYKLEKGANVQLVGFGQRTSQREVFRDEEQQLSTYFESTSGQHCAADVEVATVRENSFDLKMSRFDDEDAIFAYHGDSGGPVYSVSSGASVKGLIGVTHLFKFHYEDPITPDSVIFVYNRVIRLGSPTVRQWLNPILNNQ